MYGISQREVSNSWKLFQSVMISVISMPLYSLRNIFKLKYSKTYLENTVVGNYEQSSANKQKHMSLI